MLYLVGYSNPPKRLTLEQLNKRTDWFLLHPELRKRLVALFNASDGTVGIGGGWRSSAGQELLFRSRYVRSTIPTPIVWDGSWWVKRAGVASAAPPGLSYHEATLDGCALAADLIGDLRFVHEHGDEFGVHDFGGVNREPWHVQPVEIPNSRRTYNEHPDHWPLNDWCPAPVLDPPPAPPFDEEDDDMKPLFIGVEGSIGQYLWAIGSPPIAFTDTDQRDLMLAAMGIELTDGVTITPAMFERLA